MTVRFWEPLCLEGKNCLQDPRSRPLTYWRDDCPPWSCCRLWSHLALAWQGQGHCSAHWSAKQGENEVLSQATCLRERTCYTMDATISPKTCPRIPFFSLFLFFFSNIQYVPNFISTYYNSPYLIRPTSSMKFFMILQTINVLSHLGIPEALFVSLFWPSHSLPHIVFNAHKSHKPTWL